MTVVTKIGCISKDQWDNIKMISASVGGGNYTSFQFPVGTYYAPASGIALRVGMQTYYMKASGKIMQIGYGDDTVDESGAPPTNPIILIPQMPVQEAYQQITQCIFLLIPSGKYPFLYSPDSDGAAIMSGYEDE